MPRIIVIILYSDAIRQQIGGRKVGKLTSTIATAIIVRMDAITAPIVLIVEFTAPCIIHTFLTGLDL